MKYQITERNFYGWTYWNVRLLGKHVDNFASMSEACRYVMDMGGDYEVINNQII